MKKLLLSAVFLMLAGTAFSQAPTKEEFQKSEWQMKSDYYRNLRERADGGGLILDQTDYDVKYWVLDINVTDIDGEIVSGVVTMTSESVIDNLTTIDYDYHSSMEVDSVRMNGSPAVYNHHSSILTITLDRAYNNGELFTTVVYYHGHPPGGGFGSFTWETHSGQPIISTLSEPEGAREWWPCKDMPHDKGDSADVLITVPDNLVATSNGRLISNTDNGDGTRTFHWDISYPITTYLICLAISNYQVINDWYVGLEGDSMPVVHYVYPEHYNNAVEDLEITPDAIGFYASLFGEYPFLSEKYGHSVFPWGGAMEHQCNTSYGSGLIRGDHYYDWILVHELSHQWFGDMITCDIWPDIWMNEGFASYCEALWIEHLNGFNAYVSYMTSNNGVSDPSGPIYNPNELFDGNTVYNKGSWVLHMLRGVMGDSSFFAGMYGYANHPEHQYGTITTRGFQHIMEGFYGDSLGWFFDEWVWGRNRPTYVHSWMEEDKGNGQYEIFLHVRQTQGSPAPTIFTMPIRVYPRIGGVDTVITVWNDARIADYRFLVNGNPTTMLFDRYQWILRNASSESYRLNIVPPGLMDGFEGIDYIDTVEARGGTQPYIFSVQSGLLPSGLSLDSTSGVVSGIPDNSGPWAFTIRVRDSSNPQQTDDQNFNVNIINPNASDDDATEIPSLFALAGNYPNPFNAATTIKLRLGNDGNVRLEVYNLLGQRATVLHDGFLSAGEHNIIWDGQNAPSGVYFYKLTAGEKSQTRKMLLLK